MSTLKLTGSSSGSTSLQAPASGSDRTITFPNNAGTVLTNATPGCILQVKQNTDTTTPNVLSMATKGQYYSIPNLNVAITPVSTSNKILISFQAFGEGSHQDHKYRVRLERAISGGATTHIQGVADGSRIQCMAMLPTSYFGDDNDSTPTQVAVSNYLDSPSTDSEITYTVQISADDASTEWHYNRTDGDTNHEDYERGMSYITVMEVAG